MNEELRKNLHIRLDEILNNDYIKIKIHSELDKALNSGALDTNKIEDNYELPKIVLSIYMKKAYYPLSKEGIKTLKNLEYFI